MKKKFPETAPELVIPIGEPVQIHAQENKYKSFFRGFIPSRWIFMDMPQKRGRLVSFAKQTPLLARYIHQGTMFGFRSKVNSEYLAPSKILVIEFPRSVEERNLRRSERIKTFIPLKIRLPNSTSLSESAMLDLSREGALLSIEEGEPPEIGEKVYISLRLPDGSYVSELGCVVRNAREPADLRLVGVEFDHENEKQVKIIQRFYDYCLSPMG